MLSRFRTRLTYANVVSTICLFVLLGGSAVALDVVPFAEKAGFAKRAGKAKKAKKARKAKKAGKVDGLSASQTPQAGKLLALDGSTKFPASVLPNGLDGTKGDKGDTGPTYGFTVGGDSAPAVADREAVYAPTNFTLPTSGKLYVSARVSQLNSCDTGDLKYGLYVDDVPVPGSGRSVESGVGSAYRYFELAGVTGTLAAGTHQVKVGLDCYLGNYSGGGGWPDIGFTGILLGS